MQGVNIKRAPSASLVLPHYGFAAAAFFVLTLLILLSPGAFIGHYFNPHLLALTHIAALGWGTMLVFGALYQLLPVILEASLYSERLGRFTFYTLAAGVILLAYSFWTFSVGWPLQTAAALIFIAVSCFGYNVMRTAMSAEKWTTEGDFIAASAMWLWLTVAAGVMMAFNFRFAFLERPLLMYLKVHAHAGLVGWFVLLIAGVGSKLIPMFLLSHDLNRKKLDWSFYLINAGLIAFAVNLLFFNNTALLPVWAVIIAAGIACFIAYLREAYVKRPRKKLDTGLSQSFIAFLVLLLPLLLGIFISTDPSISAAWMQPVYVVYGFTAFAGFITTLIFGQTFKTLPFIVWLKRYSKQAGKGKIPMPKDLYSDTIAKWQMRVYAAALVTMITGIMLGSGEVIRAGGLLLLITSVLYNINVFKVLFQPGKALVPNNNTISHGPILRSQQN